MYKEWSQSYFPLGPNWSDYNGYSAHNTYLRILFEQGIVNFLVFIYAILMAYSISRKNIYYSAGIIFLMSNAFVVDATHWRILFIAIGISMAMKYSYKKNLYHNFYG
jgi:O-antigen ligase